MKTKSKELSAICLSYLNPNINSTHHYYLASLVVAAKRKIMVIDEIYYLMWADRELKAERTYFNAARAAIDNCSIRINLNQNTQ